MRLEAIKKEKGFLIPMTEEFINIKHDRILLEVEIIKSAKLSDDSELVEEFREWEAASDEDQLRMDQALILTKPNPCS